MLETCSDDDEEDLKRIIRRKNESPTSEELFPGLVAQERKAQRQRAKQLKQEQLSGFATPPPTSHLHMPSSTSTSSYLNSSGSNRRTDTSDEDDPFVKAALERFDAFCKSKSTQSLDKAGLGTLPPG